MRTVRCFMLPVGAIAMVVIVCSIWANLAFVVTNRTNYEYLFRHSSEMLMLI